MSIDIHCCDNLDLLPQIDDNSVGLIYCDILYGTGRKFKDYQDLKPKRDIIEDHYIPRIKEMRRVLKDTGSIYLQMDTKINHWIRCVVDDIFGYDKFRNEIIWKYGLGGSSNNSFSKKHDNIIFYSKSETYTFNIQFENSTSNKMKGKQKKMVDVWDIPNINNMAKERVNYNTQKPKTLVERIIKASSNEGDLVGDFYAGSFTTAEVCKDLNRNFIGCDISERACEIGRSRIL